MRKKTNKRGTKKLTRGGSRAAQLQSHRPGVIPVSNEEQKHSGDAVSASHVSVRARNVQETASRLVPYDETLLDRARVQWQFGDWDSLSALDRVTLQNHPERGKLALLAAAGYLQKGDTSAAGELIHLAQDWGCSKKVISQILISGLHNTLGRAAAIAGQQPRALKHFESAISIGAPGSEVRLIAQARAAQQLTQLSLSEDTTIPQLAEDTPASLMPSTFPPRASASIEALQKQNRELVAQLTKQSDDQNKLRQNLEMVIKKEILNSTKQLEAFIEVRNYLSTGEVIGDMHGWPISPDFALYLIELIETNDYDVIVEFGSGTSTVLIAKALAKIASRRQVRPPVVQVAFEHLPEYHAQTLVQLQRANLADSVQLVHAPLVPYVGPNGVTYSYYDCKADLLALMKHITSKRLHALLVIDGPPGVTNKHARYPAVPMFLADASAMRVDILLDDFDRNDEKEVMDMWTEWLGSRSFTWERKVLALEKGACLLTIK